MSQAEKWKIKKSLCVLSVHKKVVKSFELMVKYFYDNIHILSTLNEDGILYPFIEHALYTTIDLTLYTSDAPLILPPFDIIKIY